MTWEPNTTTPNRGARFEVKCIAEACAADAVETWIALHPAGFRAAFPERRINNVYFDAPELPCFWENLSGSSVRTKCRLRWYGDTLTTREAVLEIKAKRNRRGTKRRHPVRLPRPLADLSFREIVGAVAAQLPDSSRAILQEAPEAVLLNHFRRRYWVSFDGRIRITLDRDLAFYDQRFGSRLHTRCRTPAASIVILECKFDSADAAHARRTISTLPGRVTKCSKYALGIEWLLGY